MSRQAKIIVGVATFWPIVYVAFFVGFIAALVISQGFGSPQVGGPDDGVPKWFIVFLLFHIMTGLLVIGLMIFYIVDLFRNPRVPGEMKALWAIVLFLGNLVSMPVYWYLYIWREPKAEVMAPPVSLQT